MGTPTESSPYPFGDLLALARLDWVRQVAARLSLVGFADYRRSDALAIRALSAAPASIGELAGLFGVTHQAARKLADSLKGRGYLEEGRDPADGRRVVLRLSPRGEQYAAAVRACVAALNSELAAKVTRQQLASADAVLRAVLGGESARRAAERLIPVPER